MKKLVLLLLLPIQLLAQGVPNSVVFWDALKTHCGKSYEGEIVAGGKRRRWFYW